MAKLRLRAAARADLAAIDNHSAAEFGQDVADGYSRGFRESFELLRDHPLAGSERPELGTGIRSLRHRRHQILYTVNGDIVLIVRVLHHAMDARLALRRAAK